MRVLAPNIRSIRLLKAKHGFERLEVTLWLGIYAAAAAVALAADPSRWPVSPWIVFALAVVAHGFSTLFTVWSMKWNVLMKYGPAESIDRAEFVLVEPVPHAGSAAITALIKDPAFRESQTAELPTLSEDGTPHASPAAGSSPSLSIPSWLPSSPVRFEYQSTPFHLARVLAGESASSLAFVPISCPDRAPLRAYSSWAGWANDAEIQAAERKWGKNTVEVPPPTFGQLLKEQALAPFFVFQIFSVGLWMLDEYWYYSLYSLSALLGMEALQAFQRLKQHGALRSMRPDPSHVYRLRKNEWTKVPAKDLLPGDMISLVSTSEPTGPPAHSGPASAGSQSTPPNNKPPTFFEAFQMALAAAGGNPAAAAALRNKQQGAANAASSAGNQTVVPADCVLVTGSAVVNEAMLTGESAPVLKDAIPPAVDQEEERKQVGSPKLLDAFLDHGGRSHARHVLFAGTTLLQTTATAEEGEEPEGRCASPLGIVRPQPQSLSSPPAPDGGALAVVVRTGYTTSQGALMRTISHASQKVGAGSWEAFVFIAGLLVFAIAAAWFVLEHGWSNPRHNRYKLVLHCIMIMTSVVPPELPIELALAVNASLATLVKRGIFCTEPFRVVFGGLVDTTVFDKTGTLTSDEFHVAGVVAPIGLVTDACPSLLTPYAYAESGAQTVEKRGGRIAIAAAAAVEADTEAARKRRLAEEEAAAAAAAHRQRRSKYDRASSSSDASRGIQNAFAAPSSSSLSAPTGPVKDDDAFQEQPVTTAEISDHSRDRAALALLSADSPILPLDSAIIIAGCNSLMSVPSVASIPGAPLIVNRTAGASPQQPGGHGWQARPAAGAPPVTGAGAAASTALVALRSEVIGDPMEKAALQACGWAIVPQPSSLHSLAAQHLPAATATASLPSAALPSAASFPSLLIHVAPKAVLPRFPLPSAAVATLATANNGTPLGIPPSIVANAVASASPGTSTLAIVPSAAGGARSMMLPEAIRSVASVLLSTPPTAGIRVLKRFAFSSDLKRMSTVVALIGDMRTIASSAAGNTGGKVVRQAPPKHRFRVLLKGAPEVVLQCLARGQQEALLPHFDAALRSLAGTGARMLALAWKPLVLPSVPSSAPSHPATLSPPPADIAAMRRHVATSLTRVEAEKDLLFAGFLVISSPLKTDTRRTVKELAFSNHRVVMATGDAALTAVAVAQQVGIISSTVPRDHPLRPPVLPEDSSAGHRRRRDCVYILEPTSGSTVTTAAPLPTEDGWLSRLNWTVTPLPRGRAAAHGGEGAAAEASASTSTKQAVMSVVERLNRRIVGEETTGNDGDHDHLLAEVETVPLVSPSPGSQVAMFLPLPEGEDPREHRGPFLCVTGPALAVIMQHLRKGELAGQAEGTDGTPPLGTGAAGPASPASRLLQYLAAHASVFARASPDQKEALVVQINSLHVKDEAKGNGKAKGRQQHYTLMCGDGTNDVGALKQAHVGVSILSNPVLEKRYDLLRVAQANKRREARAKAIDNYIASVKRLTGREMSREEAEAAMGRFVPGGAGGAELDEDDDELEALVSKGADNAADSSGDSLLSVKRDSRDPAALEGAAGATRLGSPGTSASVSASAALQAAMEAATTPEEKKRLMQQALAAKFEEMKAEVFGGGASGTPGAGADLDSAASMGLPMVSLGDASMASPFTSRLPSPAACVEILRQGRCTLVVTHQVYRILAVNCLILSYMLSVLHLNGVRSGDTQATIAGISMTAFFMFVSWAKPMKKLAPVHPHTTVFNWGLILSVLGQFVIHLAALALTVSMCKPYAEADRLATEQATAEADLLRAQELANATAANARDLGAELSAEPGGILSWLFGEGDSAAAQVEETGTGGILGLLLGIKPDGSSLCSDVVAPTATPAAVASAVKDAADAAMEALKRTKPASLAAAVTSKAATLASGAAGGTIAKATPIYFEDQKFAPNIINTAVFLLSTAQQACTFVCNYAGAPFMMALSDNKLLWRGFQVTYLVLLVAASGLSDVVLHWLQLVPLPTLGFKAALIAIIVLDFCACAALEYGLRKLFGVGRRV